MKDRPIRKPFMPKEHWCAATGKIRYRTVHNAEIALLKFNTSKAFDGVVREVYLCPSCHQHHYGSNGATRAAAARARRDRAG